MITSIKLPLIHHNDKKRYRINKKKFAIYTFVYITIISSLLFCFLNLFDLDTLVGSSVAANSNNQKSAISIIINNLKNFAGYLILYPVYPLLIFLDIMFTCWSIVVSAHTQGGYNTFLLLAPHGIIEIPNFILYTYLSCSSFYHFFKSNNTNLKGYFNDVYKKKNYYLASFILVVLAGVIEGIITPLL